ncbi:DUF805 domain-containing protein [Staphylococcus caprae]|uniref:DUF805 domain-containing protein n=1 Tax=Staphylococcus TaxID=1279 RepID=UPI0008A9A2E9|nr:DUF805 domain-containing protein [Staphylococcus sp. HMSC62A08]OHS36037.1 hypothetical protein HMPREF3264_10380 [Staphylococcus sp. HMSC62A08]
MLHSYKLYWQNYFNFKGRTRRQDFWWPMLFNFIIISLTDSVDSAIYHYYPHLVLGLSDIISVVFTIGTFSLSVRRFHDIGKDLTFPIFYMIMAVIPIGFRIVLFQYFQHFNNYYDDNIGNIVEIIFTASIDFVILMFLVLLMFIYIIAMIVMGVFAIIFCIRDSEEGTNKYGPYPKNDDKYNSNVKEVNKDRII